MRNYSPLPPEKKFKFYFLAGTCPRTPSEQDRGWLVTALRKKEKENGKKSKMGKIQNGKSCNFPQFFPFSKMGKIQNGKKWENLGNVPQYIIRKYT